MYWHAQTCTKPFRTLQNQSQLNFERRIWSAWLMDKLHCPSQLNPQLGSKEGVCVCVGSVCGGCAVVVCGCHLVKCSKHRTLRRFVWRNRTRSTQSPEKRPDQTRPGQARPVPSCPAPIQSWLIDTLCVRVCVCATTQTTISRDGTSNTLGLSRLSRWLVSTAHRTPFAHLKYSWSECECECEWVYSPHASDYICMWIYIMMSCTLFMYSIIYNMYPLQWGKL